MGGPRPGHAAVALFLLSAAVLCAGQPKSVVVRTVVTEDYALRAVFPKGWTVPASLQQLIPSFMRGALTRVYRGSMPYTDMARVCSALAAKRGVTLAAKKKLLSESVQVVAATAPCSTGRGITPTRAGASPATFLVLVKKFNAIPERSYTVLRCVRGSKDCILYRLAPPCIGGVCKIERDPTLTSTVFSEVAEFLPGANEFSIQDAEEQAKENPEIKEQIAVTLLAYNGDIVDDEALIDEVVDSVGESLSRVVANYQAIGVLEKDKTPGAAALTEDGDLPPVELGLTKFAIDNADFFTEFRTGNIGEGVGDDEEAEARAAGSASAAAMSTAAVYGLAASDFVGMASTVDMGPNMPPVRDQGNCEAPWLHAALAQVEAALKKAYPDQPPEEFQLSAQQVLDCLGVNNCKAPANMNTAIDYILANALHLESNYDYSSAEHGEVKKCMVDDIDRMFATDEDDETPAASAASLEAANTKTTKCPKKCGNQPKNPCQPPKNKRRTRASSTRAYKACLAQPNGKKFQLAMQAFKACRQHNIKCARRCGGKPCPGGRAPGRKKPKKAKMKPKKNKKTKQANSKLKGKKKMKTVSQINIKSGRSLLQEVQIPERQAILKAVLNKGIPIYVTLSGNVLQDYVGGVINPKLCNDQFNHAAVLVGYNANAWKLQNSMGADHGQGGFFWLAMKEDQDNGPCGLYFNTMWVDIDPDEIELVEEDAEV